MSIDIKKAKLTSVSYMEVEYSERIETKDNELITFETSRKCNYEPHSDLTSALDTLKKHLANLCEQEYRMTGVGKDGQMEYDLSKFKVTGFVVGGSEENRGVTIIGSKKLGSGKVLNLVAPFTKFEDESDEAYPERYELEMAINYLCNEVVEYLNGKRAPKVQQELDFD